LSKEDKQTWKAWEQWDAKRYAHHLDIYNKAQEDSKEDVATELSESEADTSQILHVPKKRKSFSTAESIPKKSRI